VVEPREVHARAAALLRRANRAAALLYDGHGAVEPLAVIEAGGSRRHHFRQVAGRMPSATGSLSLSGSVAARVIAGPGRGPRPLEFDGPQLLLPETRREIARLSPSFNVLVGLLDGRIDLPSLAWRELEELIADLLERDGYTVKLGPGRKDGGVDVLATKDLGPAGLFVTVWQAKRLAPGYKVGLPIIRELADVRKEERATKGIVATTTYLTGGAIARVRRDQHALGKVDRDDLMAWIAHTVRGR
jgi:Restriction endonuclease